MKRPFTPILLNATGLAQKIAAALMAAGTVALLTSCAAPGTGPAESASTQISYLMPHAEQRAAEALAPGGPLSADANWPDATLKAAGPLDITIVDAVLVALENNQGLVVQKLNPPIARTFVEQQRAAFDPVLQADISASRERINPDRTDLLADSRSSRFGGGLALAQYLPTGTSVALDLSSDATWRTPPGEINRTRLGLSVTQAMLRDFGIDVNLVSLRQARIDVLRSQYELRGFAEQLVAEVERTYWQTVLAEKRIQIFEDSLRLAEQQLQETSERIRVGRLAETELAAGQAELARRREGLINARSALATSQMRLLRLLNPQKVGGWQRQIIPQTEPQMSEQEAREVQEHLAWAMRMRPDLNEARLGIQRNQLEIVRTRNGLLPQLDLFIALGRTGYADSFGESWRDLADGDNYDLLAGLRFEYPPYNRAARALHERARLNLSQANEAVTNLAQLVQLDVRTAHIEVERAREQVAATAATRNFQEEALRAETEKFRVGVSTSLLVAQVQRDLLTAQIAEVEAAINYMIALVDLYRLDGSLLSRRGIVIAGQTDLQPPPSR